MAGFSLSVTENAQADTNRWLTGRLDDYAESLGVTLKGEHVLVLTDSRDPLLLAPGKQVACSCGWKKLITVQFWEAAGPPTSKSPWIHEILKEHVLSFTDPTHYTYYPQGV